MSEHEIFSDHEKFKELGALANSGSLTVGEWAELKRHLETCEKCREAFDQYLTLATDGIPMLTARYSQHRRQGKCDDTPTRRKVFAGLRTVEGQSYSEGARRLLLAVQPGFLERIPVNSLARPALAACLIVAIGFGAYRLSSRTETSVKQAQVFAEVRFQKMAEEKKSVEELLDRQEKKLFQLQQEGSQKERGLAKLKADVNSAEERANKLAASSSATVEQLQTILQQRDALKGELRDAEQAYQNIQGEVSTLRSDRAKSLQQSATLESRIEELSAANHDLERKLMNDEMYLASDRDIRELMGARKLYIADVFDVDSSSRTRKPFGRIFYTQGKSLLFYAFDLDRDRDPKNADTFQAWGGKETELGQPLNLGIFYKDNESDRRWVLRFDDPKELAEIDSVFVTVEPSGGSSKPTAKPFLYALLRKEANHP
jgi:archaellum component FlaC